MFVSPRDITEELYNIRRQHGSKSSPIISASFEFVERLRRYLPWLWQPQWIWTIEYIPNSIECTFTAAFDSRRERYVSATCSIRAPRELLYNEDESEARRYQIYMGDARRGIITVNNAYDAAKLVADILTGH